MLLEPGAPALMQIQTPESLINEPMAVLAFLSAVVAGIFWLASHPRFKSFFHKVPAVIFVYFVPMFCTTA